MQTAVESQAARAAPEPRGEHDRLDASYHGVRGWLNFIVIANLYIGPVIVGLRLIFAWIGFAVLYEDHPTVILTALITTPVEVLLTYLGVQAAKSLRDIRPGAVQQIKRLLKLRLGWQLVGVLVAPLSGLDLQDLIPAMIRSVVVGIAAFAIGWIYFSVSRKVKATYPDWNA